jgi:SecD/SecF fusion protein
MQNRGAIKFFAIAFALVCLFQLSFTYFTNQVEKDAKIYANSEAMTRLAKKIANGNVLREQFVSDSIKKEWNEFYLDSIKNEEIYNFLYLGIKKYTYSECKDREINLGLDLKGGMNVTLEVKVQEIVKALSGNSDDPVFVQAIQLAKKKQRNSQADFVTLFGESFEEIDPNAKLAAIFTNVDLKEKIKYNSTNEEVLAVIREEADGAIDRAFNILNTRINRFGVSQPNIQKLATAGRILVELPGIKEPERVRKLLQGTAKLGFWETHEFSEVANFLADANTHLRTKLNTEEILNKEKEPVKKEKSKTKDKKSSSLVDKLESDSLKNSQSKKASFAEYAKNNPLYAYLQPAYRRNAQGQITYSKGATVGMCLIKDTSRVNNMLKKTATIFPRNLKFAWTVKAESNNPDLLELIALKVTTRDGSAPLSGDAVIDARQDFNQQDGSPEVSLSMNKDGARIWKKMTGNNIGKQVAIVLDGYVYSHPVVNGEIAGGRTSISGGNMQLAEAKDLANILKAGKLPAPTEILNEEVVGPSLGKEAIQSGLWSFVIAFILVLVYMMVYYNQAGIIANLALITNIFFLFGVLASLGAVLTLPGIAGIVLTLGMAVDANVIIYERIKEEIRAGKGLRIAITDGYKNAYSAIIDGNVTTLLTGIVLYIFGSGPVQGFATTLIIGILSSLFSAIFISRLVFSFLLNKNKEIKFSSAITKNAFANVNFDYLKIRKTTYIISSLIIVIGIVSLFINGLNYGVDFSGGRTYIVRFDNDVKTNEIRKAVAIEFDNMAPEVKTFGPTTQVKITTKYKIDDTSDNIDSEIQRKLFNGLKPFFTNKNISYNDFSTDVASEDKMVGILSSQKVGPTIADDIRNKSVMAIIFALIVIFIYIAARFNKWQYGLAGVIALFHDSLITISLFSLFYTIMPFNMEIDQAFIAAILTIIGYSINDTVIIFDRIREFTGLYPKKQLNENINAALNSTLSRTINTSGTTLIVLLTIFIFGGEIIRGFTFALLIGVIVGTYSSLFTASPIAFDLIGEKLKVDNINKKKK